MSLNFGLKRGLTALTLLMTTFSSLGFANCINVSNLEIRPEVGIPALDEAALNRAIGLWLGNLKPLARSDESRGLVLKELAQFYTDLRTPEFKIRAAPMDTVIEPLPQRIYRDLGEAGSPLKVYEIGSEDRLNSLETQLLGAPLEASAKIKEGLIFRKIFSATIKGLGAASGIGFIFSLMHYFSPEFQQNMGAILNKEQIENLALGSGIFLGTTTIAYYLLIIGDFFKDLKKDVAQLGFLNKYLSENEKNLPFASMSLPASESSVTLVPVTESVRYEFSSDWKLLSPSSGYSNYLQFFTTREGRTFLIY